MMVESVSLNGVALDPKEYTVTSNEKYRKRPRYYLNLKDRSKEHTVYVHGSNAPVILMPGDEMQLRWNG